MSTDNDHTITGELRRYASYAATDRFMQSMLDIADRIDAAHEAALLNVHTDLMDASGWLRLPRDADGEYIHIGDVMEFSRFEIECPVTREVDGVGKGVFFAWCGERGYEQLDADSYSHRHYHHAPTVEDVLREFALACEDAGNAGPEVERIASEYAAKLRLAESEDE